MIDDARPAGQWAGDSDGQLVTARVIGLIRAGGKVGEGGGKWGAGHAGVQDMLWFTVLSELYGRVNKGTEGGCKL